MGFRTLVSELVARSRLANIAGHTFRGKRDIYKALGYQRELFANDYRSRYIRNAVANRVVKATPYATWHGAASVLEQSEPNIITPFEQGWFDLEQRLKMWSVFQRADVLAGIGRYAVILLGLPGDMITPIASLDPVTNELMPPQPLTAAQVACLSDKSQPKLTDAQGRELKFSADQLRTAAAPPQQLTFDEHSLKYVRPYSEEDAKIFKFDLDPLSPRFGLPLFYNLTRTTMLSPESTNSNVVAKVVHWTRIIHVADGLLDDSVYGEPRLQCVWNLLDDLEKVTGAGAEAFWRRADRGIQFDLDPTLEFEDEEQAGTPTDVTKNPSVRKQIDEMQHGLRNYLFTRGVKIKELGSNVANFAGPVASIITQISAGTGIPQRLLMGSERGELASSQDKEEWNDRIRSRRLEFAGPTIVRPFTDLMIAIGVLPKPDKPTYWVRWPSVSQMNETQKATLAQQYIALNKDDTIVTRDEVRDIILGLPPMTQEQENGESSMWKAAETATFLSVNEKRLMTGYEEWTGDIDTSPYADMPQDLIPKESLKIADPDVPQNAPGGKSRPPAALPDDKTGVAGKQAPTPALNSQSKLQQRVAARKGAATETHVHRAADRFRLSDEARRLELLRLGPEGRAALRAAERGEVARREDDPDDHVYGRDGIRKEIEG